MLRIPETQFASVDGQRVAYQVLGDGPIDVLFCTGMASSIDNIWDDPDLSHVLRRVASFGRLILFDPRETGASDPLPADQPFAWEFWVDDIKGVLDAAGSERAALVFFGDACPAALVLAASDPGRVSALLLSTPSPRSALATDVESQSRWLGQNWATDAFVRVVYPSRADDPRFVRWFGRYQRTAGSPAKIESLYRQILALDAGDALSRISAPTLVFATESVIFPSEQSRSIAEGIAGSRFEVIPSPDVGPWFSHPEETADLIEEFLTGRRGSGAVRRQLATVLFSDIVASTETAARAGDRRWRQVLDQHDEIVRERVERLGGRLVKTTGDGVLATFEGPATAIRCGLGLRDRLASIDVPIRCGIHAGEVEIRGDDVGGIAVHIAARVMAEANPGEVLASSTVKELVAGSGMQFADRGARVLKGIPGEWRLYSVEGA